MNEVIACLKDKDERLAYEYAKQIGMESAESVFDEICWHSDFEDVEWYVPTGCRYDRQICNMRIVKEAEERRNEILDVAEELFALKGYDATSTNDILNRIGIARGTLYYHFESKESILDAMIERISNSLIAKASVVASRNDIPVVDRIVQSIMSLNVESRIGDEIMKQVHKPQNALMHQKMQEYLQSKIVPIITKLVGEGIEEGIFKTDYPKQTVEMLLLYSAEAFDAQNELTNEQMLERMYAFIYNTERLLGAKSGSMTESMKQIFV